MWWRATALAAAAFLADCGPESLGFSRGLGAANDLDFCPGAVDCGSQVFELIAPNERLSLAVGRSIEVQAFVEILCPDLCASEIATVAWQVSEEGVVAVESRSLLTASATGLAPGEVTVTARITFRDGQATVADQFSGGVGPLVITVVAPPAS